MAKVTDPVCGMEFDSSQAEAQTIHEGQSYFFCSQECRHIFEENPKEFVNRSSGSSSDPVELETPPM